MQGPSRCSVLCEVHGVKDMVPTPPQGQTLVPNTIDAVMVYPAIRGLY